MRRTLGAIHRSPIGKPSLSLSLKPFSSGRGRGSPPLSHPAGDSPSAAEDAFSAAAKPAVGHGRGSPLPAASAGLGQPPPRQHQTPPPNPSFGVPVTDDVAAARNDLHLGIVSALAGAGRGKPSVPSSERPESQAENRHLQPKPKPPLATKSDSEEKTRKLSREDAVKKALGILTKEDDGVRERVDAGGRGGFRGRGRGSRGGFRGRGRGRGGRESRDEDEGHASGLYLGDDADGEKLAKKLGPEKMDMLVEAFEEMSARVLPSPAQDAYIDALHTNMMLECEPEYLMEEFGTNPDIDDTPPIPLRDALEKMKPFLMAYEGIQSHEEWEKIMEETMKNVPLMKEIVDYYSGPDRVTAKQQQKELRRVADTIPDKAHASVKRFADRAILSLQSNPGWGFDKKCQFMDKLVWETSQHYK